MEDKKDIVIVGGGMAGLVTALCAKDKYKDYTVCVIEKDKYPFKKYQSILLPTLSRKLLHNISFYNKFRFNEGRFKVFSLYNEKYNLNIPIEDTAIIDYASFVYILYQIAISADISVYQNSTAIIDDNKIYINNNCINCSTIIDATGNTAMVYKENKLIDNDVNQYNVDILHRDKINCDCNNIIKVGDVGGAFDYLTAINSNYTIVSTVYAVESITDMQSYYKLMFDIYQEVMYSYKICESIDKIKDFSFLNDVVIKGTLKYKDVYNKLVKEIN